VIELSNIMGFLGIVCTVIIYQQKSRVGLLVCKLVSDVIWFLQYALLGAWSGAAISIIAIIRELVFINRSKKWANSPVWLAVFLVLSAVSGIVTWKNIYSLFPCIASALAVIGFWIGNPRLSRLFSYPISFCMLTYDIANLAWMAIVNEILTIGSSIVGNIRYDIKKTNRR
jgi:hypothetical protein